MSNKMKKKQLKQIKNQAQEGRSMVEMLGVLAIIGVLSIGGIAGYRWGMDKHITNQILYEMNLNSTQLAMLLQRGNADGVTLSLGSPYDEGKFRTVEYEFDYGCGESEADEVADYQCQPAETGYFMKATGLPKRVCNMLSDGAAGLAYASELEINDGADECDDTNNTVTVFFDTDTTADAETPQPGGSVTHTPTTEVTEAVTSPTPETTTLETTTTETTTPESANTECDETCPVMCNAGGNCECPGGSKLSADGSKCECPAEKPLWTGTECTTCPEGSQTRDGKCFCDDGSTEWKASAEDGACEKERLGECEDNADCKPGEYCYLYWGYGCSDNGEFQSGKFGVGNGPSDKGECRNARGDAKEGEKTGFVLGKADRGYGYMTWWSAGRFCAALGRSQATLDSIKCSLENDNRNCLDFDGNMIDDLRSDFGSDSCMWLADEYGDSCRADNVCLYPGYVYYYSRDYGGDSGYAFCE